MLRNGHARTGRFATVISAVLVATASMAIAAGPVASATATHLVLVDTPPPLSVVAGTTFSITVGASDGSALVTDFSGGVTIASSDPTATFDPASPYPFRPQDNGKKTFTVRLSSVGSQTVTFSSAGLTPVSATVLVTMGAARKVGFLTQPGSSSSNVDLPAQPRVAIQDASGNTITDSTANVTLRLLNPSASSGTPVLSCSQAGGSMNATGGIAQFSGCRIIGGLGREFRIVAEVATLTSATSVPFDISSRMTLDAQPASGANFVAATFITQPKVQVHWPSSGTLSATTRSLSDNSTTITLSIKPGTGASGAVLTCDQPGNALKVTSGAAQFSGCRIDKIGTGYRLVASASPYLTPIETNAFNITAGAAQKLTFFQDPTTASAGVAFPVQPVVGVTDNGGNVVPTARATVVLSLGTNTGGGTLSCVPSTAVATATSGANVGKAVFAGCSISKAGTYTIIATPVSPTCGGVGCALSPATSRQLVVTAPGATVSLVASAATVVVGRRVTLTATLAPNGAGKPLKIQRSLDGVAWTDWVSLTTGPTGAASYTFSPSYTFSYRAYFAGTGDLTAGVSAAPRVFARQSAIISPHSLSAVTVALGRSKSYATTVRPKANPAGKPVVRYYVWKKSGTSWKLMVRKDVTVDAYGVARYAYRFATRGSYRIRSVALSTAYNSTSPATTWEYVRVP